MAPFQAFRASDCWFVIAAAKEKFWTRIAEVIDRPELAETPVPAAGGSAEELHRAAGPPR